MCQLISIRTTASLVLQVSYQWPAFAHCPQDVFTCTSPVLGHAAPFIYCYLLVLLGLCCIWLHVAAEIKLVLDLTTELQIWQATGSTCSLRVFESASRTANILFFTGCLYTFDCCMMYSGTRRESGPIVPSHSTTGRILAL